ncbi:hypothetical protein PMEGAS228_31440 [Priestia megaterium]
MAKERKMKLAAYLIGTGMHVASWRHPDSKPDASQASMFLCIKSLHKPLKEENLTSPLLPTV